LIYRRFASARFHITLGTKTQPEAAPSTRQMRSLRVRCRPLAGSKIEESS
jgi:hypothetical protein